MSWPVICQQAVLSEQTASCTLPTGETITVSHRVPLYTLARELDARGYGGIPVLRMIDAALSRPSTAA